MFNSISIAGLGSVSAEKDDGEILIKVSDILGEQCAKFTVKRNTLTENLIEAVFAKTNFIDCKNDNIAEIKALLNEIYCTTTCVNDAVEALYKQFPVNIDVYEQITNVRSDLLPHEVMAHTQRPYISLTDDDANTLIKATRAENAAFCLFQTSLSNSYIMTLGYHEGKPVLMPIKPNKINDLVEQRLS